MNSEHTAYIHGLLTGSLLLFVSGCSDRNGTVKQINPLMHWSSDFKKEVLVSNKVGDKAAELAIVSVANPTIEDLLGASAVSIFNVGLEDWEPVENWLFRRMQRDGFDKLNITHYVPVPEMGEKMVRSRRGVIVRTSKGFEIEWADVVKEN
jgi:hypothetical protein